MSSDPIVLPPAATRRVEEFSYALSPNHARYRAVVRYFYEQHLKLRDWLAPREVFDHVQRALKDPEYGLEDCEGDLRRLQEWGNLIAEQDQSKARTLAEFYRPRLVYHLTQLTVDLEALLRKHEGQVGTGGSLNATLLDRIWFGLEYLREVFAHPTPSAPDADFLGQQIEQPWSGVLGAFTELRESATAYHHTLSTVLTTMGTRDADQHRAFLLYKDALLEHLKGFVTQLQAFAPRIRGLLASWQGSARGALLVQLLTDHDRVRKVSRLGASGGPLSPEQIRAQVHGPQLASLTEWFGDGGGCDLLYQTTAKAILVIARQNERIVTRHELGLSRRRDLERLARAFAALERPADAHRLAARAFGAAQPRHMRGNTQASALMTERTSVWLQEPQQQPLRRVRRGRASSAAVASVRTNDGIKERMQREAAAVRRRERELWDRLFAEQAITFDGLALEDPVLRGRLLDVLSRCLLDPDREALASDGRRVRLTLPPAGAPEGALVAPDGTLHLPRFTLSLVADVGAPGARGAIRLVSEELP